MITSNGIDTSVFRVIPEGLEFDDVCRVLDKLIATDSGCWEWSGRRNEFGYGQLTVRGKTWKISRVMFESARHDLGKLFACHHCDNPACARPDHLFAGTAADNAKDCQRKGRRPRGAQHWTKLRPNDVKQGADRWWTSPASLPRGDDHWSHSNPAKVRRGEGHHMAKLNATQVSEIRKLCASGEVQRHVARAFGVHPMLVSMIVNRKIWKHVT